MLLITLSKCLSFFIFFLFTLNSKEQGISSCPWGKSAEYLLVPDIQHGYHIYQRIWDAIVGEELYMLCECKMDNKRDRYAVAVIKDDIIVGHLPRKFSHVYSLFICRGVYSAYATLSFTGIHFQTSHEVNGWSLLITCLVLT